MTTPHVVPLTPAQFAAAKRCESVQACELRRLRMRLAASAPGLSPRVVAAWAAKS